MIITRCDVFALLLVPVSNEREMPNTFWREAGELEKCHLKEQNKLQLPAAELKFSHKGKKGDLVSVAAQTFRHST